MYEDIKKALVARRYSSISEFFRDVVRRRLYPELTENGFTPEFEEEVLRRSLEPQENDIVWDGKGSFTDFVLKKGKRRHDKG